MDSWPNLFLFCGVGGAAEPAAPGSQQPGAKQMFRCGRGAAPSRAPRRPRLPWRRPGRLLSRSALSRPLSDYLHLRCVRHTARILIRSPPLPRPCGPMEPTLLCPAHYPPAPTSLGLIKNCQCIPDGAKARGGGEMPCTLVFRNYWPQLCI